MHMCVLQRICDSVLKLNCEVFCSELGIRCQSCNVCSEFVIRCRNRIVSSKLVFATKLCPAANLGFTAKIELWAAN
jgi:hypothetical protein